MSVRRIGRLLCIGASVFVSMETGSVAALAQEPAAAVQVQGYRTLAASGSPAAVIDRVEGWANERNIPVIARINHGANADSVGESGVEAETLIFGHPMAATPFIAREPRLAAEFPLRVTAARGGDGDTFVVLPDPDALARTYGLQGMDDHLDHMRPNMSELRRRAVGEVRP